MLGEPHDRARTRPFGTYTTLHTMQSTLRSRHMRHVRRARVFQQLSASERVFEMPNHEQTSGHAPPPSAAKRAARVKSRQPQHFTSLSRMLKALTLTHKPEASRCTCGTSQSSVSTRVSMNHPLGRWCSICWDTIALTSGSCNLALRRTRRRVQCDAGQRVALELRHCEVATSWRELRRRIVARAAVEHWPSECAHVRGRVLLSGERKRGAVHATRTLPRSCRGAGI